MNTSRSIRIFALFSLLTATYSGPAQPISPPAARPMNRFSVSGRFGFNIEADFREPTFIPRVASVNPGPGSGGALDRFYDDGYVRVDGSGNAGGLTWFWGYDDPSQVDAAADSISFHASRTTRAGGNRANDVTDDPQLGFELTYQRELGTFARNLHWGVETAFGWTDLEITESMTAFSRVSLITDSYALGGIIPPQAPYRGGFSGPSAVISDTPNRQISTTRIQSRSSQSLEGQIFSFRLGPYLEIPLASRWLAQVSAGLSLAYIESDFDFSLRARTAALGTIAVTRGSSHKSEWLAGPYFQAGVSFAVNSRFSLFTGFQYHHLGSFDQRAGGAEASLHLGSLLFVTTGLSVSF